MILKRFYEEKLAQASYLIGCSRSGEAAVIDPNRDVEQYIEAAAREGLRITAVTETHIHADYVSGSRELADRTGARLYLSDEGDANWKYGFANQPNVTLVRDGDSIRVGNVRLDVMKTPGHTPEHIAFILTDEPASKEPQSAFTGDFIFVGDVGRPDLLERAAGFEGTMEIGARTLFDSLSRFRSEMPDSLLLWPAHGSGSACGKNLGGVPVSTLGYERMANWALRPQDQGEFVSMVLEGQPEPPVYFKEMKRINRDGPPLLGGFTMPPRLAGEAVVDLVDRGGVVVDIRSSEEAAAGFIPGVTNIPEDSGFTNWAGWLLPYDRPIYLLAHRQEDVAEAVSDLRKIGLDHVGGWFGVDALEAWESRGRTLATVAPIDARTMIEHFSSGKAVVVDVRGKGEFEAGHIPGVMSIPLGYLREQASRLPKDRTVVVHCQGGGRSPIGVSVLRAAGFVDVMDATGGFSEYEAAGLPIETGPARVEPALR